LVAHYGQAVTSWLDSVPGELAVAAQTWGLSLIGYHDAGHASALALAATDDGTPVVVKAWFDHERYRHEMAALNHWEPFNGRIIRVRHDERALACLELVGGMPGGGARPADDHRRVAQALARIHAEPPPDHNFPSLEQYLVTDVEPRVRRRMRQLGAGIPRHCVEAGLDALEQRQMPGTEVLLHADLYRENVPVGSCGPVFLDPLPMVGAAAFDWAFFVVYFALADDPVSRLRAATAASAIPVSVLLPWCLTLCLDGLLYYREAGDDREWRMIEVMTTLIAEASSL
jgi:streptomycin 6-kinase